MNEPQQQLATQPASRGHRFVHGHSMANDCNGSPTYVSWMAMRNRCLNPKTPAYRYYGGRGIAVCERWDSFDSFLEDMGERPNGMSLDRIDNDKNYEPSNCRWASRKQQSNNQRSNHVIERGGERLSVTAWAERLGISVHTIKARIKRGWPVEMLLNKPSPLHQLQYGINTGPQI